MQDLFLNCLVTADSHANPDSKNIMDAETKQQLRHVLKSYSLLSKQRLAEQLFTDYKVKPFMIQVNINICAIVKISILYSF